MYTWMVMPNHRSEGGLSRKPRANSLIPLNCTERRKILWNLLFSPVLPWISVTGRNGPDLLKPAAG